MKALNDYRGVSFMAEVQPLKLSDSKRTYPWFVSHARTMQAETVSCARKLLLKQTENL